MKNLDPLFDHLLTHDYRGPMHIGGAGWFVREIDERVAQCRAEFDLVGLPFVGLTAVQLLTTAQAARFACDLIGNAWHASDRGTILRRALCKLDRVVRQFNSLAVQHADWARWGPLGQSMQMHVEDLASLITHKDARMTLAIVVSRLPEPTAHERLAAMRKGAN